MSERIQLFHSCLVNEVDPNVGLASSACCTFVTGPSRTADIELTLTLGVHGPERVVVVMGPEE
jgi:L-lactate utilization protein LutC